jgi:hypothetical protein
LRRLDLLVIVVVENKLIFFVELSSEDLVKKRMIKN